MEHHSVLVQGFPQKIYALGPSLFLRPVSWVHRLHWKKHENFFHFNMNSTVLWQNAVNKFSAFWRIHYNWRCVDDTDIIQLSSVNKRDKVVSSALPIAIYLSSLWPSEWCDGPIEWLMKPTSVTNSHSHSDSDPIF